MRKEHQQVRCGRWTRSRIAALCLATLSPSCSTTQQVPIKQADIQTGNKCGLLGSDCNRLTAGQEGQAALRYVNPAASWSQYQKILIEPVTFWGSDTTQVSAADQQALVNYFQQVLREELGKKFQLADQVGPGVMRLQVALTDASAATPGMRTVSMIVPQARTLNTLKYAATGTYAFVGGAEGEMKLTDASTGQLLAAAMDKRIGGGSLETAAQWQWGDAENAMKAWATQLAERLSSWTSGAAKAS
jgi:Protein of unknown function (DUF3313)